ncbi:hypothetical protein VP01_237g1 [Puccinia sorghi]|uniref:Uncharacterized protein n=1 Tax=Puccinia sorghi TaxID=27349 RepID=A0A0L6V734_9BASI|nr:hypothetical protein VP01_237g1 [Puccinia sorghi]
MANWFRNLLQPVPQLPVGCGSKEGGPCVEPPFFLFLSFYLCISLFITQKLFILRCVKRTFLNPPVPLTLLIFDHRPSIITKPCSKDTNFPDPSAHHSQRPEKNETKRYASLLVPVSTQLTRCNRRGHRKQTGQDEGVTDENQPSRDGRILNSNHVLGGLSHSNKKMKRFLAKNFAHDKAPSPQLKNPSPQSHEEEGAFMAVWHLLSISQLLLCSVILNHVCSCFFKIISFFLCYVISAYLLFLSIKIDVGQCLVRDILLCENSMVRVHSLPSYIKELTGGWKWLPTLDEVHHAKFDVKTCQVTCVTHQTFGLALNQMLLQKHVLFHQTSLIHFNARHSNN